MRHELAGTTATGPNTATATCSCGAESYSTRAYDGEDVAEKAARNIRAHAHRQNKASDRRTE